MCLKILQFHNNANEIISNYDKSSFFVDCDNQHDQENMILKNEIILRVMIRRGSQNYTTLQPNSGSFLILKLLSFTQITCFILQIY